MKKFRYRMENLLRVKIKLEDQMKIAYSIARQNLTKEEELLRELTNKKLSYENELRLLRSDRLDILQIKQCENAIEVMKGKITQQTAAVRNAQHKLEVARIRLNNAMIERKIQEKLRENALEEYMQEYEAEEQKEIDELNSFNYSGPKQIKEDE